MSLDTQADFEALRDTITSHVLVTGHYDKVLEFEPKVPPGNGLVASVFLAGIYPSSRSGMASTSVVVVFNIRSMMSMLVEPQEKTDPIMAAGALAVMRRITEDFTLDGLCRNVILLPGNPDGEPMRTEAGYVSISGQMQRALMTFVPCIVNDVWSQSP